MNIQVSISNSFSKKRVAASFSKAAKSYDAYASLQREVAGKLIKKIEPEKKIKNILDLGSGTGCCTEYISKLFPHASIFSLDISEGMLAYAKDKSRTGNMVDKQSVYICADGENLPFNENSFDLIISSLTIQWCQNYAILFSEIQRVLSKGGQAFLSSFGPETLQELRSAWASVDDFVHVNEFASCSLLKQAIGEQEFSQYEIVENKQLSYYSTLAELVIELKSIGAHNVNDGQLSGLTGRGKIKKLKRFFEAKKIIGTGIPVTYALQYISLLK